MARKKNSGFDISRLITESRQALFTPASYFAKMPKSGGFEEPLVKALIYSAISGVISCVWVALHLSAPSAALFNPGLTIMGVALTLLSSVIGGIVGLFLGGVILLVLSAMCGGNTDYEACLRITAATMILYAAQAFIGFMAGIIPRLYMIINLLIALYGFFLLFLALTRGLKGKRNPALAIVIVLGALAVIGTYWSYSMLNRFSGLF